MINKELLTKLIEKFGADIKDYDEYDKYLHSLILSGEYSKSDVMDTSDCHENLDGEEFKAYDIIKK